MTDLTPAREIEVKFGGWFNGDNHKPGRGWYVICSCGHVGRGQLLPASAWRQARKHRCKPDSCRPDPPDDTYPAETR